MKFQRMSPRARAAGLSVGGAALVFSLVSCAGVAAEPSNSAEDETSVEFGVSVEEWQAAFEDIEPITLVMQGSTSATGPSAKASLELAEDVHELSGGKVTIEVEFGAAISGSYADGPAALMDGRLDLAQTGVYLTPEEFPAGALGNDTTVMYPTSQIAGFLAGYAAHNQTWWTIPEMQEEFAEKELTLITPMTQADRVVLACNTPVTSLSDMEGKQVRVAPRSNYLQVEALGGTPVAIPINDLFESVQRGIVDCVMAGMSTMTATVPGLLEYVPYVSFPVGEQSNLGYTSAQWTAGSSWTGLPLVVRQLIFDQFAEKDVSYLEQLVLLSPQDVMQEVSAAGGQIQPFEADMNAAIAEANQELFLEPWTASTTVDGDRFLSTWDAALAEWQTFLSEQGFSDAGFEETDVWTEADIDWDAYRAQYYEKIVEPNRPS